MNTNNTTKQSSNQSNQSKAILQEVADGLFQDFSVKSFTEYYKDNFKEKMKGGTK